MTALRRLALGFPLIPPGRRGRSLAALSKPGEAPYFIEWDPGSGVYGEEWSAAPRDQCGVLLSGSPGTYQPTRIAQFGLHRHAIWYERRDDAARFDFLAQATWLRDHQQPGGAYVFGIPWMKYGAAPGWSSAMAQGEAISLLLRAHAEAPGDGFADAAVRAAQPFSAGLDRGGVVWRDGRDVFFEEIASEPAAHVLNGCIFALWGLWELSHHTRDVRHLELIEQCVDTLARWIRSFDSGWWTYYSLLRTASGNPHIATLKYHEFHIAQMAVLRHMFDRPAFNAAARRWTEYAERRASRGRLMCATLASLPDRLLGRDTVGGGAHT